MSSTAPDEQRQGASSEFSRGKPNLLFVFSDEHRACSLEGQPYTDVQTPNLARFASEATSFQNCISNYPLCSPYRAMLLSGRWPYQTKIIDNSLQLGSDEISLGEVFRRAGYDTGYIGKWHLSPGDERGVFIPKGPARQGFEDWQVWSRTKNHFGAVTFDSDTGQIIRRAGYSATLMTDAAIEFIGAHVGRPWLLVVSWGPPHPPFELAPPETMQLYEAQSLQLRPNVPLRFAAPLRERLHGYYAHISALDTELGRLLDKLDQLGEVRNTIVVYTSDHGTMMGSHGYGGGKRLPFDEACKVPFLLRYPGVVAPNRTSDTLLGAIDLFPSLCGLAGLPIPGHCEGLDLSGAMRGSAARTADSAFLMNIQATNATAESGRFAPLFRGVRTERLTYAIAEDGRWCLYDDREDPYQMHNLVDDPAYATTIDELDALVANWLERAHDPFPLNVTRTKRSKLATPA